MRINKSTLIFGMLWSAFGFVRVSAARAERCDLHLNQEQQARKKALLPLVEYLNLYQRYLVRDDVRREKIDRLLTSKLYKIVVRSSLFDPLDNTGDNEARIAREFHVRKSQMTARVARYFGNQVNENAGAPRFFFENNPKARDLVTENIKDLRTGDVVTYRYHSQNPWPDNLCVLLLSEDCKTRYCLEISPAAIVPVLSSSPPGKAFAPFYVRVDVVKDRWIVDVPGVVPENGGPQLVYQAIRVE